MKFAGFHKLKLDKKIPLSKDEKFSVLVSTKFKNESGEEQYYMPFEAARDYGLYLPWGVRLECEQGQTYIRRRDIDRGSGGGRGRRGAPLRPPVDEHIGRLKVPVDDSGVVHGL